MEVRVQVVKMLLSLYIGIKEAWQEVQKGLSGAFSAIPYSKITI
jgi:hypothetical protein